MKCSSTKIEVDTAADGRRIVKLIVGNHAERVGKHFAVNQVAWVEMPPGMARSIAADLIEVADEIENQK